MVGNTTAATAVGAAAAGPGMQLACINSAMIYVDPALSTYLLRQNAPLRRLYLYCKLNNTYWLFGIPEFIDIIEIRFL